VVGFFGLNLQILWSNPCSSNLIIFFLFSISLNQIQRLMGLDLDPPTQPISPRGLKLTVATSRPDRALDSAGPARLALFVLFLHKLFKSCKIHIFRSVTRNKMFYI
jgi:hypothetical protein